MILVEISDSRSDGKWVAGRVLSWEVEVDAAGSAVEYGDGDVPDHSCYSVLDVQGWFVSGGVVWYRYTFSARAESLLGEYAIRVREEGGSWTDWVSKYLGRLKNPRSE